MKLGFTTWLWWTGLLAGCLALPICADDWPQWAGPDRNFVAPAPNLANWPEGGPEELWRRPLGEGYSAISVVGEHLYTQYRDGDAEIVIAARTDSGETVWEYRSDAPALKGMMTGHGRGPHSTPLVHDGRVFTVGGTGHFIVLDAENGGLLWQVDLWKDLDGDLLKRGYGASPVAWKDTVIVTVGGEQGLVAFDQTSGETRWQRQAFSNSQASPLLIGVDGRSQLVAFVANELVAVDPDDGELLWRHRHPSGAAYNISTPVWDAERRLLFVSSAYGGGGRVLRLHQGEDGPHVEEVWHHSRFNIHFTNALLLGDHLYASSGRATVLLQAVSLEAGEILWRKRAIGRANFVAAGDRVVALEAEGRLLLLGLSPDYPSIYSQTQLFPGKAWTAPTVVGERLYARSNDEMVALRLPVRQDVEALEGDED